MKKKFVQLFFYFKKLSKILAYAALVFLLLAFGLAFTTLPFHVMHFMGTANTQLKNNPDFIVLLGGAGMPNEENLMRLYYTAYFASKFEEAQLVLALPGNTNDSTSAINLLRIELENRGIQKERIILENKGLNTRHQALLISNMIDTSQTILLITSPFHMFRSRLVFAKTGFHHVGGAATFNGYISHDILFDDSILGGNRAIPDIGVYSQLRYQFWNHLKYEIEIAREGFALLYYKLKGWI